MVSEDGKLIPKQVMLKVLAGPHNGECLEFCHGIIGFVRGKNPAGIGHNMRPAIGVLLSEDSPNAQFTRISV